jgi:hypothetical protein
VEGKEGVVVGRALADADRVEMVLEDGLALVRLGLVAAVDGDMPDHQGLPGL